MKKNYFKILIVIAFTIYNTLNLNAQCTPDLSHKTSGVIPAVLPAGNVGQSYEQVLQFYIVKDTVVTIPGLGDIEATIDSFSVTSITGYPAGLTYQCNTSTCTIPGGGNGCIKVSGTPTQKGIFPLQIFVRVKATALGFSQTQNDTITSYVMTVNSGVSINEASASSKFNYLVYPNPVTASELNIDILNKNAGIGYAKIIDIQGKTILNESLILNNGLNKTKLNISNINKGIYFIQLFNGVDQVQQKLIIE